jgi:glycosyltransferase involved in cell wall biosynthesis
MKFAVFTNIHSASGGGGARNIAAWSGALRQFGQVALYTRAPVARSELAAAYGLDLEDVDVKSLNANGTRRFQQKLRSLFHDLHYDAVLRHGTAIPGPTLCRRAIFLTDFPFQKNVSRRESAYLNTYACVVANSRFTAAWVRRRWHREPVVIHPAVQRIPPLPKLPIIAAVGRFAGGPRGKYQLEMVEAFREISGRAKDWRLHLCGFAQAPEYVERVRRAARDLPVALHLNAARADVEGLLGRASIFWHATGVDFSEEENPDYMEHFGISVAEAMSAGCVPVVVGRGGLPEVVGARLAAWTWQTWPECITRTKELVSSPSLLAAASHLAQNQAAAFDSDRFRNKVAELMERFHLARPGRTGDQP